MLLHERRRGSRQDRKEKAATRAFRPTACRKPASEPLQATPPRVLMPMPRAAVLAALDSASVQLTPNPAFPLTLRSALTPRTAEPSCSRMPSPEPGMVRYIVRIVLCPNLAETSR